MTGATRLCAPILGCVGLLTVISLLLSVGPSKGDHQSTWAVSHDEISSSSSSPSSSNREGREVKPAVTEKTTQQPLPVLSPEMTTLSPEIMAAATTDVAAPQSQLTSERSSAPGSLGEAFGSERNDDACQSNDKCHSARCYIPWSNDTTSILGGRCQPSPFHVRTGVERKHQEETRCLDSRLPEMPPAIPADAGQPGPEKYLTDLTTFQHLTSAPFQQWYKWDGDWVESGAAETVKSETTTEAGASDPADYSMSSAHEGENEIYRIKNACLRPNGAMAGFNPKPAPYEGVDEVFPVTKKTHPMKKLFRWVYQVQSLPKPPTHFLDTKVLVMPIFLRGTNPGHVFHRMGSLLELRNKAFPDLEWNDTKLVTAYAMLEAGEEMGTEGKTKLWNWGSAAHTEYTTVVSQSHFAVYPFAGMRSIPALWDSLDEARARMREYTSKGSSSSSSSSSSTSGEEESGSSIREPITRNNTLWTQTMVCFKEIVVYHTSTGREGLLSIKGEVKRGVFPLFGWKSERIMRSLVERLRQCSGVVQRPQPNRENPTVLFSVRTVRRRFSLTPYLIDLLAKRVQELAPSPPPPSSSLSAPRFLVHEMQKTKVQDLVRLYNGVDVVIAPYGAGLFFSVFSPVGSSLVEISEDFSGKAKPSGLNDGSSFFSDYGGNARAGGQNYMVLQSEAGKMDRLFSHFAFLSLDVSPGLALYALEAGICVLRHTGPNTSDPNISSKGVSPATGIFAGNMGHLTQFGCSLNRPAIDRLQLEHARDEDGTHLKRLCNLLLPEPEAPMQPSRLLWFCRQAATNFIQKGTGPLGRLRVGLRSGRAADILIVAEACGNPVTTEVCGREALLLLEYVQTFSTKVFVWTPPPISYKAEYQRNATAETHTSHSSLFDYCNATSKPIEDPLYKFLFKERVHRCRGELSAMECGFDFNRSPELKLKTTRRPTSWDFILASEDLDSFFLDSLKERIRPGGGMATATVPSPLPSS